MIKSTWGVGKRGKEGKHTLAIAMERETGPTPSRIVVMRPTFMLSANLKNSSTWVSRGVVVSHCLETEGSVLELTSSAVSFSGMLDQSNLKCDLGTR